MLNTHTVLKKVYNWGVEVIINCVMCALEVYLRKWKLDLLTDKFKLLTDNLFNYRTYLYAVIISWKISKKNPAI